MNQGYENRRRVCPSATRVSNAAATGPGGTVALPTDTLAVSMQKKPHAKVAKAAKTQAANVGRSLVLHSLVLELFFSAILT